MVLALQRRRLWLLPPDASVVTMALSNEQQRRLEGLQNEFCTGSLVDELYGIKLLENTALWQRYQAWLSRTRARSFAGAETPERVNRHWLEIFFQRERIVPARLAAARLGMTEGSLDGVHAGLATKGVIDLEHDRDPAVVSEAFLRDLSSSFETLRNRVFSDHENYCSRLHEAVLTELKIKVEPLHCATAKALGETAFAHDFDAITLEPLSLHYQVWLETKKPMSLKPDICGLLTYFRNKDVLHPILFAGREPHQLDTLNRDDLQARLENVA